MVETDSEKPPLDEKKLDHQHQTSPTSDYSKRKERDFAYQNNNQTVKPDPEKIDATATASSKFNPNSFLSKKSARNKTKNSFDVDLEANPSGLAPGEVGTPPNTTQNSTLNIAKTNTLHSNASSPADIGLYPTPRFFNDDVELGNGETTAGSTTAAGNRGRTRRRNGTARRGGQPGPNTLTVPDAGIFAPGVRRAHSLPSRGGPNTVTTALFTPGGPQPSMVKTFNTLLVPEHKLAPPPGWKDSFFNIVKYSWLNVMLIFVPIAWGVHYGHLQPTVVFVFSFLAIIPLAALLGFATEQLAIRVGQTLGGLLNATFGNAVELIIAILALTKGKLRIVQASMLGSILSNCLLVLGMCFFAGGFRFHEQGYGVRAAQLNISLLSISVFSIVIPAAFSSSLSIANPSNQNDTAATDRAVLAISRGTSIVLLIVYAAYLVFQLWTHAYIYSPEASAHHSAHANVFDGTDGPGVPTGRVFRMPHLPSLPSLPIHGHSDSNSRRSRSSSTSSSSSSSSSSNSSNATNDSENSTVGEEVQHLKPIAALLLLLFTTVITGVTAEFLVDSIDGLTSTGKISREFVALILLPLVGNAAEHVTAVTVSVKNKLDLAITVAVGSSIQIALFVIPFLILLGWIIGQPLSLFFDIYETIVVFVSILVVNYAIGDGKTNWLEGLILMVIYVLIALTTWYYPGTQGLGES